MQNFEYIEAKTVQEACALLAKYDNAKVLAGGASLMVLLKNKLLFPDQLINLKTVVGLNRIEKDPQGGLSVGALCRQREIELSPIVKERCGVLAEAASKIASPPIRNMGTIGGNICHSEPSADLPPALIALKAKLKVVGSKGSRTIPVHEFFTDYYENILEPDEILTEIQIPPLPSAAGEAYLKLSKTTNSAAIVGVAAVISLDAKGICTYAGVGVGGAASTPLLIAEAGSLVGKSVNSSLIEDVASAAAKQSRPISDVYASAEYRREMVDVLTKRAVGKALKKAENKMQSS